MSVKHGKLIRRGAGRKFVFRYQDNAGAWQTHYTGTADRGEAETDRDQFLADLRAGQLPTSMADWRLDQAMTWWNDFRRPRLSESNRRSEPYRLPHLQRILGNVKLREITNRHLDTYQTARIGEGISAEAINREIAIWSQIFTKAKVWHRLRSDYHTLKVKTSSIGQALTRSELRRLADVAQTNGDWEAAFHGSVLAANSGLRPGEILSLLLGDIYLHDRRIILRHAKTAAGVRTVELNGDACEAVARLLMRARELGGILPEHYLMPKHLSRISRGPHKGQRGYDPLQHQTDWGTAWGSLTNAAGFPGLRFYDLRHSFITAMVLAGVPLGTVMAMVGHVSKKMVLHYTHITSGAARRAVEVLDKEPMLDRVLTTQQPPAKELLQ